MNALREYLPETAALLEKIAAAWGTRNFDATLARLYPKCADKSVDYGILEPRSAAGEQGSNIFCIPADWGWNDLGSWAAHFEHRLTQRRAQGQRHLLGGQLSARCPRQLPARAG